MTLRVHNKLAEGSRVCRWNMGVVHENEARSRARARANGSLQPGALRPNGYNWL